MPRLLRDGSGPVGLRHLWAFEASRWAGQPDPQARSDARRSRTRKRTQGLEFVTPIPSFHPYGKQRVGTSLPTFSLKNCSLSQNGASMQRIKAGLSPTNVAGSRPRPSVILPSRDCRDLRRETVVRRASRVQRLNLSTWYGRPRTLPLKTSSKHQSIRVGDWGSPRLFAPVTWQALAKLPKLLLHAERIWHTRQLCADRGPAGRGREARPSPPRETGATPAERRPSTLEREFIDYTTSMITD